MYNYDIEDSIKIKGIAMYRITIVVLFLMGYYLIFGGCEDKTLNTKENENPIKAFGTYQIDNVNKYEWGDFQLVLEMEKSLYTLNEPILTKLYFLNIGEKTIILDGILPYRQSANPPTVDIWSSEGKRFRIVKILDNLLNENDIIIDPAIQITLMQFDLTNVEGFLLQQDTSGIGYVAKELNNIGPEIIKGIYYIRARFDPTPQIYWSTTDTLTFIIE